MSRTHYTRGQVTLGGSVIVNVDNFTLDTDNALALHASMADPNGIPITGMIKATFGFDLKLSNDQTGSQAEVALISGVMIGTGAEPLQLGYKNGQITIQGLITPATAKLGDKLGDPA